MSSPAAPPELSQWARRQREALGLSRSKLALEALVPEQAIKDLETGTTPVIAPVSFRIRRAILRLNPKLETAPLLESVVPDLGTMVAADLSLPPPPAHVQLTMFRAQGRLGLTINLDASAINELVDSSRRSTDDGLPDGEIGTVLLSFVEHKR